MWERVRCQRSTAFYISPYRCENASPTIFLEAFGLVVGVHSSLALVAARSGDGGGGRAQAWPWAFFAYSYSHAAYRDHGGVHFIQRGMAVGWVTYLQVRIECKVCLAPRVTPAHGTIRPKTPLWFGSRTRPDA